MAQDTTATGRRLKIGSRGSDLALWQARNVAARMHSEPELVIIKTRGDRIRHIALDKVEGVGFFTKEIEAALLGQEVDIAVHSYKDLPTEPTDQLHIAAVPERGPVGDLLVLHQQKHDPDQHFCLQRGARLGTSSLRRKALLAYWRPDLQVEDVRGNVPTRLGKVRDRQLDAIVIAEAGVARLDLWAQLQADGLLAVRLPPREFSPAPAQGALAVQVRHPDAPARAAVAPVDHTATARAVAVERELLAKFGGGCHLPLGAYCTPHADGYSLHARVTAPNGSETMVANATGDPEAVVTEVYEHLVYQGAKRYV